jgi:hypothetical protein
LGKNLKDFSVSNKSLSVIICECGFEIPVIDDADKLGAAIDDHIEEHRVNCRDIAGKDLTVKRIHDALFNQLFEKIALMPL